MIVRPSFAEFKKRAAAADLVPVTGEIPSDLETPVSAYIKVAGNRPGFLLESVEGGEKIGRYSFLGTDPGAIIRVRGRTVEVCAGGRRTRHRGDPLAFLRSYAAGNRVFADPGLPRFSGGLVGYFGYDIVRNIERLPALKPDCDGFPDACLFLADNLIVFDHVKQKLLLVVHARTGNGLKASYDGARAKIDALAARLEGGIAPGERGREFIPADRPPGLEYDFTRRDFERAVKKAKAYIRRGDVIQVVLSQRIHLDCPVRSEKRFNLYRVLRSVNPSPYLFFLNFGPEALVGSSPEVMVRLEAGTAAVRPIAGTRPRGAGEEEDRVLAEELRSDEKERAEHIMLVDLGRNDLGRVCLPGSVRVSELMTVERYSHVMHLVSNVNGLLRPDRDAFDLFAACFPAGTVSGAPKVRAMEIIEELEPFRRGPYAGAVGYFDFAGNLDTAIAIRTIFIRDGHAFFQLGAGIVADSVPEREYEETINKGRALIESLGAVVT